MIMRQNILEGRGGGGATEYSTEQASCMLNNYGYQYTLILCSIYCFSTGTNLH